MLILIKSVASIVTGSISIRADLVHSIIDLHMIMPKEVILEDAHQLCDHLEEDIGYKQRHTNVTIHVEPCGEECRESYVKRESRKI